MVSMSVVKHIPLELAMANQNFVSVVVPLSILLGCARSRRLVLKLNGQWLTLHPLRGGLSHLGRRFRLLQHQPLVLPAVLLMFGHQHRETKFRPLLPTPPARAMEVSSVEYVPAAATPSVSSSPDTPVFPVGLSIHLSEFKESVTFRGFFSYARRVSTFERVPKMRSPERDTARRIIRARRLEDFPYAVTTMWSLLSQILPFHRLLSPKNNIPSD